MVRTCVVNWSCMFKSLPFTSQANTGRLTHMQCLFDFLLFALSGKTNKVGKYMKTYACRALWCPECTWWALGAHFVFKWAAAPGAKVPEFDHFGAGSVFQEPVFPSMTDTSKCIPKSKSIATPCPTPPRSNPATSLLTFYSLILPNLPISQPLALYILCYPLIR
jgi:hypothetical protein